MAGRATALTVALGAALIAGVVAAGTAAVAARVGGAPWVAEAAVRVPVLDGVPLLDVDQVLADVRADAGEGGGAAAPRLTVVRGAHWNQIVVEARAADRAVALAAAERAIEPARRRSGSEGEQ